MCICENVMKWKGSSPKEEEKKGVVNQSTDHRAQGVEKEEHFI